MQQVPCLVCDNDKFSLFCNINRFTIVKCDKCDFIFVNPLPSKSELDKFYKNFDYRSPIGSELVIRNDAKRSLKVISRFATGKQDLLDIGCGRGFFLDEARTIGWNVYGIDYSKKTVDYASNILNLDVKRDDILTYQTNKRFSLITLNQVVEHATDPKQLIKKCHGLLNSNGYLYIATPNIKSLSARIFGCKFEHLIPPEHVSFFSEKTLTLLLYDCGFKICYRGSWGYPENLAGIIKKLVKNRNESQKEFEGNHLIKSPKNFSVTKNIKYTIFDKWFCGIFYKLFEMDSLGINLEVVGYKD